jgi:hypothetical protein
MTDVHETFLSNIPFKLMRRTTTALMAAVLPILALLDAKKLSGDDMKLVTTVVFARERTVTTLKGNPSRADMLVLVTAWHEIAVRMKSIIPPEHSALVEKVDKVLTEAAWVQAVAPKKGQP